MGIKNNSIFTGLLALLSASVLLAASVQAETRVDVPGYLTDSSGGVLRSSTGKCWHTGNFTPAYATIVGCDGVELNAPIEMIKGEGTGLLADISLPAASMFGFDKSDMSDAGKAQVEQYITKLGPELTDAYLVLVVGHTDTSGDESYNQVLSQKRAKSVATYLVSKGVKADALRFIGRGSKEPLVSNDTSEGRIQNRRVDILAVAEVRALDAMLFPSVALFERRSGELSAQGEVLLEKNYMAAKQILSRATFVEIVGYTDDVGDDDYNLELSQQRATSVRDYLVSKGLDRNKIVTTGMGENMPVASNRTPEGRAENRRVEILLLGRIKE